MGACTSRDSTVPPATLHPVLPPSVVREVAKATAVDLSLPRSSPPSITHPPLPSALPDSDEPHSRHRAPTVDSKFPTDRASPPRALPPTVELRADKEVVWSLHGEVAQDSGVLSVAGGDEGELLTAGVDKCVLRFDWQRRSVRDRWKAHNAPVEQLLYCQHTRAVFAAGRDSNIRMLASTPLPSVSLSSPTAATPSAAAPADVLFRGHTLSVSALCFDSPLSAPSTQPATLVSGGRDYSVRWWDIASQQQEQMRILPNNVVTALTATWQASLLLSANAAGAVHQWDSRAHDMAHSYEAIDSAPIVSLCAHSSLPLVLVTHSPAPASALSSSSVPLNSSLVRLYDLRMQRVLRQTPVDEQLVASFILPFTTDSALRSATVSAGGQLRLWTDGECVSSARVRGDSGLVRCASLGASGGGATVDGRSVLLYTGSTDGNVCVWSLREGGRLAVKALVRSRLPQ